MNEKPKGFTIGGKQYFLGAGATQCSVAVGESVEYVYISGLDINDIRIPKDKDAIELLLELLPQIAEDYT